jgi:membrane associated rhomboid family serine protease
MFGLICVSTILLIILYAYVFVAIMVAERKAGAGWWMAFTKAATWPATIWSTMKKLYLTKS